MKKTIFAALLLCLIPHKAHALACLGLSLTGLSSPATFQGATTEYDVFDTAEYMQTVNFTVSVTGTIGTCNYFITLSPGASGTPAQRTMSRGGTTLNYNVYTTAAKTNILKDTATTSSSPEVISGSFSGAGSQNKSFFWTVAPAQVVSAGATRFTDPNLNVKLNEGILTLFVPVQTSTITFQSKADSSVDLSLVDTGAAFDGADAAQTVDFGPMTPGKSMSFDTVIRSNDGYLVTMKSQNGQNLKHQTAADTVPYALTFGGAAVDLSSGAFVQAAAGSSTVTPSTGARFATTLTVGSMTGAETAGNYQDIITVTVAAH